MSRSKINGDVVVNRRKRRDEIGLEKVDTGERGDELIFNLDGVSQELLGGDEAGLDLTDNNLSEGTNTGESSLGEIINDLEGISEDGEGG